MGEAKTGPGRPYTRQFIPQNIVGGFHSDEILERDPETLHDFVPRIYDNPDERRILDKWMDHFTRLGTPFVVTKAQCSNKKWREIFTLWTVKVA
ncbi:hypothetical protein KKI24_17030 [bacterium]|nr:hypothetical protein [bacterium]